MAGFDKPLTLIDTQELRRVSAQLGLEVPETIDDHRRLRAENFASRIVAMLARVEDRNDARNVYNTIAAFAYAGDAEIVSHADAKE
jgi:hypothetical protein